MHPKAKLCRVSRLSRWLQYPTCPERFICQLTPILQAVYDAKISMEQVPREVGKETGSRSIPYGSGNEPPYHHGFTPRLSYVAWADCPDGSNTRLAQNASYTSWHQSCKWYTMQRQRNQWSKFSVKLARTLAQDPFLMEMKIPNHTSHVLILSLPATRSIRVHGCSPSYIVEVHTLYICPFVYLYFVSLLFLRVHIYSDPSIPSHVPANAQNHIHKNSSIWLFTLKRL